MLQKPGYRQLIPLIPLLAVAALVWGSAAQADGLSGRYRCSVVKHWDFDEDGNPGFSDDGIGRRVVTWAFVFTGERKEGGAYFSDITHRKDTYPDWVGSDSAVNFWTGYAKSEGNLLKFYFQERQGFQPSENVYSKHDEDEPSVYRVYEDKLIGFGETIARCRKLGEDEPLFEDGRELSLR